MKYGAFIKAFARNLETISDLEDLGYDEIWFPDFQLLGGDPYVTIAVAAQRTRRIRFGVAVSNPVTRHASVIANAAATLNTHYPGRVSIGLGTGSAPLKAMGLPIATVGELEAYANELRGLLRTLPAGHNPRWSFLAASNGALSLDPPISVRIAAGGPKALAVAGRVADDVIIGNVSPELVEVQTDVVRQAAAEVDRPAPSISLLATLCIDPPDELDDVIDQVGAYVPNMLLGNYQVALQHPDRMPAGLVEAFDRARAAAANAQERSKSGTKSASEYETYLRGLPAWQRELVDWHAVRAKTLIGNEDEIAAQLERLGDIGVDRVVFFPNDQRPDQLERFARRFVAPKADSQVINEEESQ